MPHPHTQRQPKFDRHITEKFQLKAQEAKAFLHPGILPVWDTQPLGVTKLPISAMFNGGYHRDTGVDLEGDRHFAPTVYNLSWRRTTTSVVTIFSNIAVGEIIHVEADLSAEVTPTGPITCQVHITDSGLNRWNNLLTVFNPICACTVNLKTPFIYTQGTTSLGIRVGNINGVGQAIEFSIQLCIFPSRELSTDGENL